MTDKEKIRKEVERMHELLPVMDGDNISINYADRICRTLKMYIDSLQEEPVNRNPADIEAAMQEVEEKSRAFTEAHKGEDINTILAQMRGEEPISDDLEEAASLYVTDDALKPWQTMVKKDFKGGGKWQNNNLWKDVQEELVSKDLEKASIIHSEIVRNTSFIDEDFIAGAVWQKEQLIKDAISAELYSDGMLTPLIGVKDKENLKGIKFGDKVKLIIIKDE